MASPMIRRGVILRRVHDLPELCALLPAEDAERFSTVDLELVNPWSIEGRYPPDLPDADARVLAPVIAAARRGVVEAAAPPR